MARTGDSDKVDVFERHRSRLFGIAYRMLGTRDDADDILQETYIRLHETDLAEIEIPEAWLVTVVTRLSIDRLRKASHRRETYIGPWLPEPIIVDPGISPELLAEMSSDMSVAFLVLLERLSPLERAVFLLHDIFDLAYGEIARVVAKSETAVRQIVSRARTRVRTDKARFDADDTSRSNLIKKFVTASYAGDAKTLMSIFADEVALISDGGGIVHAARKIVYGSKRLTRLYTVTVTKSPGRLASYLVTLNGEPGIVEYVNGIVFSVSTFSIVDGQVTAIYRVMNPNKLKAFDGLEPKLIDQQVSQLECRHVLTNEAAKNG